jgi:hypothetical protein
MQALMERDEIVMQTMSEAESLSRMDEEALADRISNRVELDNDIDIARAEELVRLEMANAGSEIPEHGILHALKERDASALTSVYLVAGEGAFVAANTVEEFTRVLRSRVSQLKVLRKSTQRSERHGEILMAGYEKKQASLLADINEKLNDLEKARHHLRCFRALAAAEERTTAARLEELRELVQGQRKLESSLQALYAGTADASLT